MRSPRAMGANHRRLHRRSDRADHHVGSHRLGARVRSRSSHKSFFIFASIALALMAARRLNNAIVAWTDLLDLTTYAGWLSDVGASGGRLTLAWNRWCLRPWRSIDVSAVVLAVAGTIGAVIHSASFTSGSRLGSITLFVVIAHSLSAAGQCGSWRLSR